jgi:tetratricopeptide (TPR) repeat protein
MSDRTPSWKDRLHRSPKGSFIGRTVQLQQFRSTLATPLEQRETLLFNISGQGGIGKTTLLKQFRRIAEELKGVAAYVDEGSATNAIDNVPKALSRLALDLEKQGYEFKEFQKQYKTYRQKKQELEADPEAPTGFVAGMGKFVTKAGIGVAKSLPGGGLLDVVDADGLADHAGQWAGFVTRKLTNKDEVQLVQEPVEVLTPLFLAELNRIAAKKTVVLLLDTYEQTGAFWQDWLLAVLEDRFTESLPLNCVLVIAGRDPLDRNGWVEWEPWLVRSELEPFSRVEAEEFLVGQGVTAAAVVEEIWRLSSGGLPVLIGMMAQGAPESVGAVSDACEDAVERFLKWEKDEAQRTLALRAALPRVLNQDVLAVVQGEEDVERLFGWLKGRSFVVQHPEGWQYHEIVRGQMLRYQRRLSLTTWERLHGQLAAFYDDRRQKLGLEEKTQWQDQMWRDYTLEWLYHSLCETPQRQVGMALNGWLAALKHSRALAREWAETMAEAGAITTCTEMKRWGERLRDSMVAQKENRYEEAISLFTELVSHNQIESAMKALAYVERGSAHYNIQLYNKALEDFNSAIQLDDSYHLAFAWRGYVYEALNQFENAINDYMKSVELDKEYAWSWQSIGNVHRRQKRYENAIASYQQAIKLDPEWASPRANLGDVYRSLKHYEDAEIAYYCAAYFDLTWALPHNDLGNLYREQEHYEEAISSYQRAIELDPQNANYHCNLGNAYKKQKYYDEAIAAYQKAIALDPEWATPHDELGDVYCSLQHYDEAIAANQKAIAIDPKDSWYQNSLGHIYQKQKRYDEAISAYQKAITIDPQDTYAFGNLGQIYCLLGRYSEAIQFCDLALEIDASARWEILQRGYAYLLMKQYDRAIQDFDQAIALAPEEDWYLYCRAIAHLALKHPEAADTDIATAIDLAQAKYDKDPTDWQNTFNLALYHLIANHIDIAEGLYRNAIVAADSDSIHAAQRDLQDFLSLFPDHAIAQEMATLLVILD